MKKSRRLVLFLLCLLCTSGAMAAGEADAARVSDNLSMEGQVFAPAAESLPVILSKRREFAVDHVLSALGIGDAGSWSRETVQLANGAKTRLSANAGSSFCIVEPGRIYYVREDYLAYENMLEFYLQYGRTPNAGPIDLSRWDPSRNPVEHAAHDASLPFMSAEEAVAACTRALAEAGIDAAPVLLDFHAFSGAALAKDHARMLQTNPEYAAFMSHGAKQASAALSAPKDIYCLLFGFTQHNVWTMGALEQVAALPNGAPYALPQKAVFFLASDGFMKTELQNVTELVSQGEAAALMRWQDALSRAARVLAKEPKHHFAVRQAYLSYLPVDQHNGQVELRPHWNFFVTYEDAGDGPGTATWMRVIRVDALSGKAIG